MKLTPPVAVEDPGAIPCELFLLGSAEMPAVPPLLAASASGKLPTFENLDPLRAGMGNRKNCRAAGENIRGATGL